MSDANINDVLGRTQREDRAAFDRAQAELTALRKVAELTNNAVEAGAIDEIYLSLIRDALAGWRRSK